MEPLPAAIVRKGLDRVLDFLDVQRGAADLPGAPLEAHFASYGMDEDGFKFLNAEIESRLFPDDPGAPPKILQALHGGAILGVAIGLAIAELRDESGRGPSN
jgi:hypothetical protein